MKDTQSKLLDTAEAVAYIGRISEATLKRWRSAGKGPDYVRLSATMIGYRRDDLDAFIAEKVETTS